MKVSKLGRHHCASVSRTFQSESSLAEREPVGARRSLRRVLRPSYFRYFHRGQGEKPSEEDYLVMRPKKVKLAEHDKLLKKFRHKEALVSVLGSKNSDNVVAVMEELVARKKLLKCVSNLDSEELASLLMFLHKYSTVPTHSALLMGLTRLTRLPMPPVLTP